MEVTRLNKPEAPPRKHVIDEYRHKAQTVTCLCGWHGSTATPMGEPSDWALHVKANRGQTF